MEKPETPVDKKNPEPEKKKQQEIVEPKKKPEPTIPQISNRSSLVKSVKAFKSSPALKRMPVQIYDPKQISKPGPVILKSSLHPHPAASLHKMLAVKIPTGSPPSARVEKTETPRVVASDALRERKPFESVVNIARPGPYSSIRAVIPASGTPSQNPTVSIRNVTQVAMSERAQTPGASSFDSKGIFSSTATASLKMSSPARLNETVATQFPVSIVKAAAINTKINANALIQGQNMHPLNHGKASVPSEGNRFASRVASVPAGGIHVRSFENLKSALPSSRIQAIPVSGRTSTYASGTTGLMQMALIPTGFFEETINENRESNDNPPADRNNSAGESEGISADQMGKIKKAFSLQVRTKIAQSKYFPRIARKRGFEGEPVVAFTLADTGDLLKVSLNKPSPYKLLDEAALDAVKSAGPYPPIPGLLKIKTISFKLPISFILERQ